MIAKEGQGTNTLIYVYSDLWPSHTGPISTPFTLIMLIISCDDLKTHKYSNAGKTERKFQPSPIKVFKPPDKASTNLLLLTVTFSVIVKRWLEHQNNLLRELQWSADRACNVLHVCFLGGVLSTHCFNLAFSTLRAVNCPLSCTARRYSRPLGDILFLFILWILLSVMFFLFSPLTW